MIEVVWGTILSDLTARPFRVLRVNSAERVDMQKR
jgi:hypothetical protein